MSEYKAKVNPFNGQLQLVPSNTVVAFKEGVATAANLPPTGNEIGDGRITQDNGHLYVWNGSSWQDQGDVIDLNWDAISSKPSSSVANIDDAVSKKHTQNTDQYLDFGGVNQRAVAEIPKQSIAGVTYYVATTGSDVTGDGAVDNPFLTIQKALDSIPKFLNDTSNTIRCSPGNYAGNIRAAAYSGGSLFITSYPQVDDTVIIQGTVNSTRQTGYLRLAGLSIQAQSNNQACITVDGNGSIILYNVKVGKAPGLTGTIGLRTDPGIVYVRGFFTNMPGDKVDTGIKYSGTSGNGLIVLPENFNLDIGTILFDSVTTPPIIERVHIKTGEYNNAVIAGNIIEYRGIKNLTEKITLDNEDLFLIEDSLSRKLIERQPAGAVDKNWSCGASDSDGSNLIAGASGGRLYTSSDYGVTWTETRPAGDINKNWSEVASSSDGSKLVVAFFSGRLYTSDDYGVTWTERQPAGAVDKTWDALASSSDGSYLIAGVQLGRLYTSSDYGVTWTERQPAGNVDKRWIVAASDSDGSNLIVGVQTGRVYTSSDYGVTWSERQPAGAVDRTWRAVSSSADGSRLIVAYDTGRVYTSSDYGVTWTETRPAGNVSKQWYTASSSSDGSRLAVAALSGRLYTSDDYGVTWTERQPAGAVDKNWRIATLSADGLYLLAGIYSGRLYFTAYYTKAKAKFSTIKNDVDIVDAISKKHTQNTDTGTSGNFDVVGELSIKVYSQDTEPILGADNRMAIWIDTNDNYRVYLIFRRNIVASGLTEQVKTELI